MLSFLSKNLSIYQSVTKKNYPHNHNHAQVAFVCALQKGCDTMVENLFCLKQNAHYVRNVTTKINAYTFSFSFL